MSTGNTGASEVSADNLVAGLTRELPNYMDRISRQVGGPVSELWSIVLAVSGRMAYVSKDPTSTGSTVRLGVPDQPVGGGRTRFELWKAALVLALEILGDPEAHHRTGFDVATLSSAVERFFDVDADSYAS